MPPARDTAAGQEGECEAFLHVLCIWVGLVLPLSLLIKTEPAKSMAAWEAARAQQQAEWQAAPQRPRRQAGGAAGVGRQLGSALEAGMRQLAGRSWLAPAASQDGSQHQRPNELAWWERCLAWCVREKGEALRLRAW